MKVIDKIHGQVEQSISSSAPRWVTYYDTLVNVLTLGRANAMRRETLALAKLQPGEAVLDIGCGTGDIVIAAKAGVGKNGDVVGLDVEPAMIAQAQRKAERAGQAVTLEIGSIEQIAYTDNTFDVVLSSLMIHHLTEQQKQIGLLELYRVLKPNGRLLIIDLDPSQRSLITRFPGHSHMVRKDYVHEELPGWLQKAGFTAVETGKLKYKQLSYAIGKK